MHKIVLSPRATTANKLISPARAHWIHWIRSVSEDIRLVAHQIYQSVQHDGNNQAPAACFGRLDLQMGPHSQRFPRQISMIAPSTLDCMRPACSHRECGLVLWRWHPGGCPCLQDRPDKCECAGFCSVGLPDACLRTIWEESVRSDGKHQFDLLMGPIPCGSLGKRTPNLSNCLRTWTVCGLLVLTQSRGASATASV